MYGQFYFLCLQLISDGIYQFLLMDIGCFNNQVQASLFSLCKAIQELITPSIDMDKLDEKAENLHRALANMEKYWPPELQVG